MTVNIYRGGMARDSRQIAQDAKQKKLDEKRRAELQELIAQEAAAYEEMRLPYKEQRELKARRRALPPTPKPKQVLSPEVAKFLASAKGEKFISIASDYKPERPAKTTRVIARSNTVDS